MGFIDWQHELATAPKGKIQKNLLREILVKLAEDSRGENQEAFINATPEGFGRVIRRQISNALIEAGVNLKNIVFDKIEVYEDGSPSGSETSAAFPPDDPVYEAIVGIREKERTFWETLGELSGDKRPTRARPQHITIGISTSISRMAYRGPRK